MCVAAFCGHLEVLKWAREHGCPWEDKIVDNAGADCCALTAWDGHLELSKWLRKQACPWDERTCAYCRIGRAPGGIEVASGSRLSVGCGHAETCAWAAEGGHLEVRMWAREQHFPWDAETRQLAAEHGHLELLQWAVENGAPWHWQKPPEALTHALRAELCFHRRKIKCDTDIHASPPNSHLQLDIYDLQLQPVIHLLDVIH